VCNHCVALGYRGILFQVTPTMNTISARNDQSQPHRVPIEIPGYGTLMAIPEVVDRYRSMMVPEFWVAVRIPNMPHVPSNWLSVTAAAKNYLSYFNLAVGSRPTRKEVQIACGTITRACNKGHISNHGYGAERRIDPTSLESWLYRESVRRNQD